MQILSLLKFGREQDIIDLWENGTLYLNPIDYYRKNEQNNDKGDEYEGTPMVENYPAGEFQILIKGKPIGDRKFRYEKFHIRESYESVVGNIYSLYSISSADLIKSNGNFRPDYRLKELGSHYLVIQNFPKFYNLVESVFKAQGIIYKTGFVNYYSKENYNGRLTVFHKPDNYSYQNEFRIYLPNDSIEPKVFKIGSLKDISIVLESAYIDTLQVIATKK